MHIGRIKDATRVIGQRQGYMGLPLRDETINCSVNGSINSMVTAWFPTPEEIAKIVAGAPVHLRVLGEVHPPVMLDVGDPPGWS